MGRVDATTPNDMAQLPGTDDTITRLLCIFRESTEPAADASALPMRLLRVASVHGQQVTI